MKKQRIVVGISGASGAPLAVQVLKMLKETPYEVHLTVSGGGRMTLMQECGMTLEEVSSFADVTYDICDTGATIASGSYRTEGMIIVPCSMKTLAGICSGYSDNLLLRAADVTLKERRRLIIVPRECPASSIHLRNQLELCRMGAVILPPVVSYYHKPRTLEDMTRQLAGKILDQMGIDTEHYCRWKGM